MGVFTDLFRVVPYGPTFSFQPPLFPSMQSLSAQGIAADRSDLKYEKEWLTLWKLNVPPKAWVFLWRLAKHSLPSGDMFHHRNKVTHSSGEICGQEDLWRHSLFFFSLLDCHLLKCVWALEKKEITVHFCKINEPSAQAWPIVARETLSGNDIIRVVVSLWAIGTQRGKQCTQKFFKVHCLHTVSFITRFVVDLVKPASNKEQVVQRMQHIVCSNFQKLW